MENVSNAVSDKVESLFYIICDFLFGAVAGAFNFFYTGFRNFIFNYSDGFEGIGNDFMGLFFEKFKVNPFNNINIIYWIIGIFIVIWCLKSAIFPIFLSIIDAIGDAIAGWIDPF